MEIKVQLFAVLRTKAGVDEICISLPQGATVGEALARLVDMRPDLASELSPERISKSVNIFLNGRNILVLDGLSTPLREGDVLNLFPPLGGG
jgi:molybdopterin synthase sulfur carrier subunit